MDVDTLRNLLIDLLDAKGKNGKQWFFPQNVDSKFKLFFGLTLGEILKYLLPTVLIIAGLCFIPPISSWVLWIVKVILIITISVAVMFYVMYRPVKGRDNIRTQDLLKEHLAYMKKQKVYFKKPRPKPWEVDLK